MTQYLRGLVVSMGAVIRLPSRGGGVFDDDDPAVCEYVVKDYTLRGGGYRGYVRILPTTRIKINNRDGVADVGAVRGLKMKADVGSGSFLEEKLEQALRQWVDPVRDPRATHFNVLLHGPSGVGKTRALENVSRRLRINMIAPVSNTLEAVVAAAAKVRLDQHNFRSGGKSVLASVMSKGSMSCLLLDHCEGYFPADDLAFSKCMRQALRPEPSILRNGVRIESDSDDGDVESLDIPIVAVTTNITKVSEVVLLGNSMFTFRVQALMPSLAQRASILESLV